MMTLCYCTGYSADMSQIVHIVGEDLSSSDVIKQVEKQSGLFIDNRLTDTFGYRQNYDSYVSVGKVLASLKQYHLECNKTKIRFIDRGHNKFIIESRLKAKPIKRLSFGKKNVKIVSKIPDEINSDKKKAAEVEGMVDNAYDKIEMPKDDLVTAPKAVVAPSKGLLNVDIVDGKRTYAVGNGRVNKNFEFDDLDMTSTVKNEQTVRPVSQPLNERYKGFGDRKNVFSAGVLGFSGPLAGFMATPHLPSQFLNNEAWQLNVNSEIQSGRGQSNANGALEFYDSEYFALNVEGRKTVYRNVEAVIGTTIAAHLGDISLVGAQNQSLGLDTSGLKLGLNYFYDIDFAGVDVPVVIHPSLKLPVGQTNNMLNTGNNDYALHVATQYSIDDYTLKLQVGYTFWGDHSFIQSSKNRGFDALFGLNFKVNQKINTITRLYFSESPLKNSNGPSFYSDDVFKLQVGAEVNYLDHSFYILGNSGLSDSASDIGVMVHWKTLID